MKCAVLRERHPGETRVAASPDMVKRLKSQGVAIAIEAGAGRAAGWTDDTFREAGAIVSADTADVLADADIVFKVGRPLTKDGVDELALIPEGCIVVGLINPLIEREQYAGYAARRLTVLAMELIPRISRAQSMDALTSQASLAGYKAVLDACMFFGRAMPMMMTAAGTIAPARVLVLGAGVAGLQAIATARRLGAVVEAFDVRAAVKEEVESLGATFVEVSGGGDAETREGYAREMDEDYLARQSEVIASALKKTDICIATARIPGRPAPRLVTAAMVEDMKQGSVIVDLAVEDGGNCDGSRCNEVVDADGVTIVGYANVAGRLAANASTFYARNLFNLIAPFIDSAAGRLALDHDDEVISGMCVVRDGVLVHPLLCNT